MAKRSRVSGRPGQRRPLERNSGRSQAGGGSPKAAPSSARPSDGPPPDTRPVQASVGGSSLTEAELARAAELESQIVAQEKAAAATAKPSPASRTRGRTVVSSEPLSVRAAHEYAYVARDVRRIVVVGGLMFAVLIALHVLINVLGVIAI